MKPSVRSLKIIAASFLALALAGCITPPLVPSAREVESLRKIDVVIYTPPTNFLYHYNGSTTYVQTSTGSSVGTAVGVNVAANLLNSAVEYAKTATSREAQGPVGSAVANIDLRALVMRELANAQGTSAPTFIESSRAFPEGAPDYMEAVLPALSKPLKNSTADAVLYVSVVPLFRNQSDQVVLTTNVWLIARSGTPLLTSSVRFIGPEHPDLPRPAIAQWWADQRYRRQLQYGVRATLKPILNYLATPLTDEQRTKLVSVMSEPNPYIRIGERVRTSQCALASDDASIIYRYERTGRLINVMAHCDSEKVDFFGPAEDPRLFWSVREHSPLAAPPTK